MERKLTCIVCPLGCELTVTLADGAVTAVQGNTCPRGKQYAENECTNPQRTITTTLRCSDGGWVAVKTAQPIPKEKMAACMALLREVVVPLPITVGDVLIPDVFGSAVVATQNKREFV